MVQFDKDRGTAKFTIPNYSINDGETTLVLKIEEILAMILKHVKDMASKYDYCFELIKNL